jgi:hypothetical protein
VIRRGEIRWFRFSSQRWDQVKAALLDVLGF